MTLLELEARRPMSAAATWRRCTTRTGPSITTVCRRGRSADAFVPGDRVPDNHPGLRKTTACRCTSWPRGCWTGWRWRGREKDFAAWFAEFCREQEADEARPEDHRDPRSVAYQEHCNRPRPRPTQSASGHEYVASSFLLYCSNLERADRRPMFTPEHARHLAPRPRPVPQRRPLPGRRCAPTASRSNPSPPGPPAARPPWTTAGWSASNAPRRIRQGELESPPPAVPG